MPGAVTRDRAQLKMLDHVVGGPGVVPRRHTVAVPALTTTTETGRRRHEEAQARRAALRSAITR